MRILMVTDFYWPRVGGVEQHVRTLTHALTRRGHRVAVATLDGTGVRPQRDADGPVAVYRIGSARRRLGHLAIDDRAWAPPVLDPIAAIALRRVAREEQPDVVHGHDWLARSAWAISGRQRPLVLTLHYYTRTCPKKSLLRDHQPCAGPRLTACLPCASRHYGTLRGPLAVGLHAVGRRVDDRVASTYVAVSRAAATLNGLDVDGARCRVVPNPVAHDEGVAAAGAAGAAEPELVELGFPTEPFIMFVGDDREEKGLPILLRAYEQLADPPRLVTIGKRTGPPLDVPDGVVVLGIQPHEVVQRAWRSCVFGVVPSVFPEPFGLAVVEAMAAGRAVIASASGGIIDIIEAEVDGLLVEPGDACALAEAMRRLLDDPALRARLGAAAAASSLRYRDDDVAASLEEVYIDALRAFTHR